MSNQKPESRAAQYRQATIIFPSFACNPAEYPTFILERNLELASLFQEEELLAEMIADKQPATPGKTEPKSVSKEVILRALTVARKIALHGESTVLVSADEMLDIIAMFNSEIPEVSRAIQHLGTNHVHDSELNTISELLAFRAATTSGPDRVTATVILDQILNSLTEEGNSTWTARVAVALTYLSAK